METLRPAWLSWLLVLATAVASFAAAFPSDWRPSLTTTQREEVFQALWETAERNYPTFELKGIDWAAVRAAYEPQIRSAASDAAFERLLRQVVAELKDSHAYLDFPFDERRMPPVRIAMDGERLVIAEVLGAAATPLAPGMELLRIDGRPVPELWAEQMTLLSASTPYSNRWRGARTILYGLPETAVTVEAMGSDGAVVTARLTRSEPLWRAPGFESRTMENGAVYLRLGTFDDAAVSDQAQAVLREVAQAQPPGLVLDVRGNGGGDWRQAIAVLNHLVGAPGPFGFVRMRNGSYRQLDIEPASLVYTGPVVLLTDPGCMSACDAFATHFRRAGRATVVGEPTGGATFEAAEYPLPHGYTLHMPGGRQLVGPDREPIETHPVEPDYLVVPSAADFAAGRDPVLEMALALVN